MYHKRDDLENLLESLSGVEKRHFNSFSRAYVTPGDEPLYMQLFQLLENGESELKANFKGESKQALTTSRKRLYENILRSLRLLHQDKSANMVIQNLLCEVEVLFNLGLDTQSLFLLKKAYNLALQQEKFGLLLQILGWESRLNTVLDQPTRPLEEIIAEEAVVMARQQQFRLLENLFVKAEVIKKKHGFVKGELKDELEAATIKAPGMPTLEGCLSHKAEFYYYFIHALYYWMTLDHDRAFSYSQRLVNPSLASMPPEEYFSGLMEHITSCVCTGRFEDALYSFRVGSAYLEKEKLGHSSALKGRLFAYQSSCELVMYLYMGEKKKLQQTIRWTEQQLKQWDNTLPFESKQVIIANLMNAYMATGNQQKADEIWESLFNKQSKSIRRDIYADQFLFRLFSLLACRNYELLPSAAAAALRYFRKFKDAHNLFEVEMPIANLLLKERQYRNRELLRELMQFIQAHIANFIAQLPGRKDFQEHYSRYVIWCDAIIGSEPFHVAAAIWYKGFEKSLAR